jgi:hypothetical protein
VHAHDQSTQVGHKLGKGFAQRIAPSDQHIVVPYMKVTRASCHSRAKTTFYAIAFWRIARLLGDGKTDASLVRCGRGNGLQPKRRTPGAIAPGGPLKLAPLGQPAQRARLMVAGRHPATGP